MMKTGQGKITEVFLDGSMRIECALDLIPSPGQYLLAHKNASDLPLPVSLFNMEVHPNGFRSAPPTPADWKLGDIINLRGVLGHGFSIPSSAKKIGLIAYEESYARLQALIPWALKQNAEIVVVSNSNKIELPEIIEIQPMQALNEILTWADYVAIDIARENLNQLKEKLQEQNQLSPKMEAQVLIYTSMPCGGVAECGVCALTLNREWKMICKEGPVFRLQDVL